ncbi:MAG: hypothetical protein WBV85_06270, partial [Solirubrobacteraceae bacterium]
MTLETPRDLDRVSSFLNIRVKDIEAVYAEWSARGAQFLTPPKQHAYEIRCYIRDPDVLALRFTALEGVIDEIADRLGDKLVVVPSNPLGIDAQGNVSRLLPKEQSSGEVLAGWLPAGACLAMAFGTMSADILESSSKRSPEPAVLFYATDDDRAGEEV